MEPQILSAADEHAVYFKEFVKQLVQKFQPLQIFCFAKTTLLEQTQGCFLEHEIKYNCNYCLLLVTENVARIDYEVQDFANAHYRQGLVTIICHSKESINEAIQANSRFYLAVYSGAKMIYSHNGLLQTEPLPLFIPTKAALKAVKHFDHRMPLADGFLAGAAECLNQQQYGICAFLLHQVVEQSCITLIRIHMAYRSEFHNLYRLLRLCTCFSNKPYKLFLSKPEDERLFDVLAKSYSSARYKDGFSVSADDAQQFYNRVLAFVDLSKTMCREKIAQLEQEAMRHNELEAEMRTHLESV